ncbi:Quinate permease [Erysiphe necator]|uniref:Putative quinate transport protein n=1 Tax=Uncinula necator TaxID=52586 RepID=A0A0B1P7C8_UNCNE|nr:Quinate permease [Erysiphe necator]KHJ34612.1 putative quinate transport protein [Erysiphe necator]
MAKLTSWFIEFIGDIKKHQNAYLVTILASFGGMLFGWDTGLIGGVLTMESFQRSFALRNTTPEEQKNFSFISGNIVSVLQAGCFFGAMSSYYLSHHHGRKSALMQGTLIFLLGSTLQACSGINTTSLTLLYIGRIVGGLGVGIISAVVPTYIGENTSKDIRGRCIGTMQLFNCSGIMISFFVNYGIISSAVAGTSLEWRIPFALQMIPGIFLLVGLVTQYETPRWLIMKRRETEAKVVLRHLSGKIIDEARLLQEFNEINIDLHGREDLSLSQQVISACENRKILYRVTLGAILMFWQQWTGTNSINYYAPQIFSSIGLKDQKTQLLATGMYGVVKAIMAMMALLIAIEQIGRKYSLMISSAGQAFCMLYIGIQNKMASNTPISSLSASGIFAVICVYLFVLFFSLGWGLVPYVLSAEVSPNHLRSLSMALSLMMQWINNFIIARLVPIMLNRIGFGTFIFFGNCSVLCFLFAMICVPETAGVPLERVHLLFEANILKGAFLDTFIRFRRSNKFKDSFNGVDDMNDAANLCNEQILVTKSGSDTERNLIISRNSN